MTATLDALWQAVEQSPDDWQRYLVLADALNDAGKERLEKAVRWMVKEGKRPWCSDYSFRQIRWWWFAYDWDNRPKHTRLPPDIISSACGCWNNESFPAAVSWLADQLERVGL